MPRHLSNADRIARAAAEADAESKAKTAKKAAKKTAKKAVKKTVKKAAKKAAKKTTRRSTKAPQRMKVIWGVGKPGMVAVAHYAYKDRDAAEDEARKKGDEFMVRAVRVPMEPDPEPEPAAEPATDAEPGADDEAE